MSLVKVYVFGTDFYSGFKASEHKYHRFENLKAALIEYKKSKSYDFTYDDGTFHHTNNIFSYFKFVADKTDKIGHAYNVTPKRKPKATKLSPEEIAYLINDLNTAWDTSQEEIML